MLALVSCSGPPQMKDEAAIKFHLKFAAEPGVATTAIFPMPNDAALPSLMSSLMASDPDGGVAFFMIRVGNGVGLVGHGTLSADLSVGAVKGFPSGEGAPDASLTLEATDAGPNEYYMDLNKGASAVAQVEFEYTASRNCGPNCGGKKSWTFSGPISLGEQVVQMNFVEEN
jgi:hypothetical protein